jgi:ADP-ribose pyrophosphatase
MRFHQLIQNTPGWKTLEDQTAFENPYLEVHLVNIATPLRPQGARWSVIHRKGACTVAPITPEGNLLLVRQERIPVRTALWEFPAGQIDSSAPHTPEIIHATALRELQEETGYELAPGGTLTPMGMFFSSPGVTDEHTYLFCARPVVPSPKGTAYDDSEAISGCRAFTTKEFREMIACGEIRDANTLSSFARLTALGLF